jgi:AraC-like DNA-binding protein
MRTCESLLNELVPSARQPLATTHRMLTIWCLLCKVIVHFYMTAGVLRVFKPRLTLQARSKILMRISLLVFFAITSGGMPVALGQNRIIDSVNNLLKAHPQKDTLQVLLLNELSLRVFKNEPERSREYAEAALKLAQHISFPKGQGEARNNLAVYNLMKGNTDVSIGLALQSVAIGEQMHLEELLANSYAILGTVYHNLLDYPKALRYLRMAQALNRKLKNVLIASKVLNALGGIARDQKQYDSALIYYHKALKVMEEGKEDYRVPEVTNNIGLIYTRQKNDALAVTYYLKALEAARKANNRRTEALVSGNIGNTLLSQKKYSEAERFLKNAIALSKAVGDKNNLSANYMEMMQLKNETGKFMEAHQYMGAYYQLKDSILNIEKAKKIAALEVQYETQKKEHAIELLERDQKIQRIWTNILIATLILFVVGSIVFYKLQQYRERKDRQILNLEIDQLTSRHQELAEKYKNVLRSNDEEIIDSHNQRLLKKAIEVVENNMGDPKFGVEKMAKEMGMSRTNMHRKMKEITGFPPSELIRNIRLRKAAMLLLNQADSVSQISFTVGFEDHSYFSKSFKKQFGVPPSEYLQSIGQIPT